MPGSRPRMTAWDLGAQSLDLPPGKALPMGTMKLTFCHRWMGMRCDLVLLLFCFNGEREPFMLVRGMNKRFSSRKGEVTGSLASGRMRNAFEPGSRIRSLRAAGFGQEPLLTGS
jgi:hypothetical protein